MRLNRFIAQYTDLSRRRADELIAEGRVIINRTKANVGTIVKPDDKVFIDSVRLIPVRKQVITILLHKPVGYVCSHDGQGSKTVFDLIQRRMQQLNIAGRLDKDSSGLVVLTNDGKLLQELTHPSNDKEKVYVVMTHKKLKDGDIARFASGVNIGDDRVSKMEVRPLTNPQMFEVRIHEGRNRQIRRSFEALGYNVTSLHRTQLGPYKITGIAEGEFKQL